MPRALLFRADADDRTGTGHVMRCFALAQTWRARGGAVRLVTAACPQGLIDRWRRVEADVDRLDALPHGALDAEATARLADAVGASWIVMDGYRFGADYQSDLKTLGKRVLFVDDYGHAASYCADLILNQNLYAQTGFYSKREPGTDLLLGPRYALLRREFLTWRQREIAISPLGKRITVSMGGADSDNVTARILPSLAELRDVEIQVLVGPANPHRQALQRMAADCGPHVTVISDVVDVAEILSQTDVVVTAAGTTVLETCFLGLPAVALVLAENQLLVAAHLERSGAGVNLGWASQVTADRLVCEVSQLLNDASRRTAMSAAGRRLVDGLGAARVAARLLSSEIELRPAEANDCRQIWEWANDPVVRAMSFSGEPIAWDAHQRWFDRQLTDSDCRLWIAEDESGNPLGQLRFQQQERRAVVSISLASQARGRGLAAAVLIRGTQRLFSEPSVEAIDAYIKPENGSSVVAFEQAGFVSCESAIVAGCEALHYELKP